MMIPKFRAPWHLVSTVPCQGWSSRVQFTLLLLLVVCLLPVLCGAQSSDSEEEARGPSSENIDAITEGPQREEKAAELPTEGSEAWWKKRIAEESEKQGRRVMAWEFDAPKGHPCYEDKSPVEVVFPNPPVDLAQMEPVPRPEMPNWWTPTACGTMNLTHPDTKECFPPDGSENHVCCVDIQLGELAEEGAQGLAGKNELIRKITATSRSTSYSWCCCSYFVCEELLAGKVEWDQHTLTHARKFNEDLHVGMDLSTAVQGGWTWLLSGVRPLIQLSENELDEEDPWYRP